MGKHPDQIDSFFAPILKGEEVSLIFINIIFSLNHCVLKLLRTFLQLPQVYGTNIKLFSYCAPFFVNSHAFAIDQDAMTLFHITKMRSNYCVCTKWAPIPIRHFFSRISKVNPSNEFTFLYSFIDKWRSYRSLFLQRASNGSIKNWIFIFDGAISGINICSESCSCL